MVSHVGVATGRGPILVLGVVEAQLDSLLAAFLGQLLKRVALERRRIDDVERVRLRIEHREAVVMLRGDHDVFHARRLGQRNNIVGAEARWVELRCQCLVIRYRDRGIVHDPLADARNLLTVPGAGRDRIQPPMDEHAKARLAPPLHPRIALSGRLGVLNGGNWMMRRLHIRLAALQLPRRKGSDAENCTRNQTAAS